MKTAKEVFGSCGVLCPHCSGALVVQSCYRRHFKDEQGERNYGWIAQGHCGICDKYLSLIPDFLMPYKHYETAVIERAIERDEAKSGLSDCAADDSTIRRWINQFKERGVRAVGYLLSALFTIYERYLSIIELKGKELLKQLARLTREFSDPINESTLGKVNVILSHLNKGFL